MNNGIWMVANNHRGMSYGIERFINYAFLHEYQKKVITTLCKKKNEVEKNETNN